MPRPISAAISSGTHLILDRATASGGGAAGLGMLCVLIVWTAATQFIAYGSVRPNRRAMFSLSGGACRNFSQQILEAVVADAGAFRHTRCNQHVGHFLRRICHGDREARP